MKVLEFIFIDFWHWLGAMTLLYITVYFITNLLNNFMRYRVMMKHGYSQCNGESSPIKEEDVKEVNDQNSSNR